MQLVVPLQAAKVTGVAKVLHADDPAYGKWVAENVSRAVAAVQVGADEVVWCVFCGRERAIGLTPV